MNNDIKWTWCWGKIEAGVRDKQNCIHNLWDSKNLFWQSRQLRCGVPLHLLEWLWWIDGKEGSNSQSHKHPHRRWWITNDTEFFEPIIVELIFDHKTNNLALTIDTIFWVGGFGGCRYLKNKLKPAINSKFGRNYTHSCPPEPQLAVVRGAVAFRYDPSVILQRKAGTYGIACRIRFDENKHRKNYCLDDEDDHSKKWCDNIFSTFIERNEDICAKRNFHLL